MEWTVQMLSGQAGAQSRADPLPLVLVFASSRRTNGLMQRIFHCRRTNGGRYGRYSNLQDGMYDNRHRIRSMIFKLSKMIFYLLPSYLVHPSIVASLSANHMHKGAPSWFWLLLHVWWPLGNLTL
jgi:hypothetical protein